MAISINKEMSPNAFPEEKKLPKVRTTNNIQVMKFFCMIKANKVSEIK